MILHTIASILADPTPGGGPPNPAPAPPPGLVEPVTLFMSWLKWGALIGGVVGFSVAAVMMIVGRRNRSSMAADGASGIPWIVGGLALASSAAGLTAIILK